MFKLTFGEEVGNAVSHGVMALLCLFVLPFVSVYSYLRGGVVRSVGVSIFIICLFLMFLISTIYHSMAYDSQQKYIFRKLDHICIYLAIAGSYTPVALCVVKGWVGILILVIQWSAVLAGILLKAISKRAFPILSTAIYLVMGWIAVIFIPFLIHSSFWFLFSLYWEALCILLVSSFMQNIKSFSILYGISLLTVPVFYILLQLSF